MTAPPPVGSGAYVGPALPDALTAFGVWRGRPAQFAVDYIGDDDWSVIEYPTWWLQRWAGVPLVLGVPMLPRDPATTIARGAAGEYDAHYKQLARTLVQYGYGQVVLRVGWEMNGDWYRWSAKPDPTAWITYYRRIVTAMRSIAGQAFRFDWTVSLGAASMPAEKAWPGAAYADYVGVDVYDWRWGDPTITPADRWAWIKTQPYGLDWVVKFARDCGKPVTVPEWGLADKATMNNGGGGDNPVFVTNILAWCWLNQIRYESYFNTQDHCISAGRYPAAADRYKGLS